MKSTTLRSLVVLAAVSVAGIVITQAYWFKRAFDTQVMEFERSVNAALFNVAQKIYDLNQTPPPATNPVKQVSTNYFVVMVNNELDPPTLEQLLIAEFERRSLKASFEYGVYDCQNEKMVYCDYVAMNDKRTEASAKALPEWVSQGYYFGVQFPYRETQLLNQMGIWIFSSGVLLLVIVFFAYALYVIFRQRRLGEIQKEFVNNMTHEFKTPISTIAVATGVLKEPGILAAPERLAQYVNIIGKENSRLYQQVDRVLQFAQIEKGEIQLKLEVRDVHPLLDEIVEAFSSTVNERRGTLVLRKNASDSRTKIDKLHFSNVMYNLLDNAVKYCAREPAIEVTTTGGKGRLEISVSDNGIGIPEEERKRIFRKFYRVPSGDVHNVKGFGIGLSYVRAVVRAHRGSIRVVSTPGEGSVFILTLKTC